MPGPGVGILIPTALPLSTTTAATAATAASAAATAASAASTAAAADATFWGEELAEVEASIVQQQAAQAALIAVNPIAAGLMAEQILGMQKQALRLAAHQENASAVATYASAAATYLNAEAAYLQSLATTYAALGVWATADTM